MAIDAPTVSVVVPTFGRGAALDHCLAALGGMQAPAGGFEVIVVDDGSPEPLNSIVDAHAATLAVTLHRKINGGPASARNAGVAIARGRWIAFTDDDCRPCADWLLQLTRALQTDSGLMVGGDTRNGLEDNRYSEASQVLVDYLYAQRVGHDAAPSELAFITSNNMAMAREAFEAVGGFDETFPRAAGEDREFCDRWRSCGRRIVHAPGARVYHYHALNWRSFWRQHSNYGRGALSVHRQRAHRRDSGLRFERLSFYTGLVFFPVSKRGVRGLPVALLLGVSQLATAAGLLVEWRAASSE